jgi:hypothetical protein
MSCTPRGGEARGFDAPPWGGAQRSPAERQRSRMTAPLSCSAVRASRAPAEWGAPQPPGGPGLPHPPRGPPAGPTTPPTAPLSQVGCRRRLGAPAPTEHLHTNLHSTIPAPSRSLPSPAADSEPLLDIPCSTSIAPSLPIPLHLPPTSPSPRTTRQRDLLLQH